MIKSLTIPHLKREPGPRHLRTILLLILLIAKMLCRLIKIRALISEMVKGLVEKRAPNLSLKVGLLTRSLS